MFYPETEKLRFVKSVAEDVFSRYGFSEIITPVLEPSEVYLTGLGNTTDIVQKEMYTFETKGGESVSMRPEGTAGVVRAFVEHSLHKKSRVTKLYYSGEMFRHERPQEGRQRSFNQMGAELFGPRGPEADSDVISMLWLVMAELGLESHVKLELNSIGTPGEREEYKKALREFFGGKKSSLCENCGKRLEINPLRVLDCKNSECRQAVDAVPFSISDYLSRESSRHLDEVVRSLREKSVPFEINPRIVRGLDYYTDTVFEVTTDKIGSQNAVAAGGRYDLLVEQMGGPPTPAVGFAVGLERILLLCERAAARKSPPAKENLVFVIHLGDAAARTGAKMAHDLRKRGLRVETEYESRSMKSQMRKADRSGAGYCVIMGDDELRDGVFSLRDMRTGKEKTLALEKLDLVRTRDDFAKFL